jgi:hypothetical protein
VCVCLLFACVCAWQAASHQGLAVEARCVVVARLQAEAAYTACLTHQHKHGPARLALARLALGNGQVPLPLAGMNG